MIRETVNEYAYTEVEGSHTHAYLWDPVLQRLRKAARKEVFDLGCGNGALARHLKEYGLKVTGVDPSESGIAIGNQADPSICLEVGNAYDDLAGRYGTFPAVVSLEVVEHVYYPRKYAQSIYELLEPGGIAIISTPYHGYLKNLALAVSGKLDSHFTVLWDHGHIKFWSIKTLSELFAEKGLRCEDVLRVARIPMLAKSMILTFRKEG